MLHEETVVDPRFEQMMYRRVAVALTRNLGTRAYECAHAGIARMRAAGDEQALSMWMSIHEHLVAIAPEQSIKTVH
jgi:hypothetical protein